MGPFGREVPESSSNTHYELKNWSHFMPINMLKRQRRPLWDLLPACSPWKSFGLALRIFDCRSVGLRMETSFTTPAVAVVASTASRRS